jgi:pSer/pThr/pTyr-binding forkhead associated (FHA) protein
MAKLVILSQGMTGRSHDLKVDKTTIGRVDDNTFPIAEASVSSHHCEVFLRGEQVVVNDLNSTNGTFINGERLTGEAPLKPGQILRLGTIEMRLESGETAAAKPKQTFDKTRVIPQGVKAEELEGQGGAPEFKTSGFEKRSNSGAKVFVIAAVVIGLVLIAALVWVLTR